MRSTSRIIAAVSLIAIPVLASCAATDYSSSGRTYFGFTIGVESAPPPPRLLFQSEPRYDNVEDSPVRVIEAPDPNCDMFEYQGWFYVYYSGYWYRGDNYGGPYRAIDVHRVPRPVLVVPEGHWHHRPHWDRDDRGRGHEDGDRDNG